MGAGGFMGTPSSLSLPTVPFCSDALFFSTAHSLLLLLLSPFLLLNGPSVIVSVIWFSGPCTNKGIPSLVYKYPHHPLSPLYPFFSCSFLIPPPPHHPQSLSLFKRILHNCLCDLICKYIHSWVELNNKFTLWYEHSHVQKKISFSKVFVFLKMFFGKEWQPALVSVNYCEMMKQRENGVFWRRQWVLAWAPWQPDRFADAATGCVLCTCICVCKCPYWIMRLVSMSLSANLWIFAGCCHFDMPSSLTFFGFGFTRGLLF